jgi:hypothetical protein
LFLKSFGFLSHDTSLLKYELLIGQTPLYSVINAVDMDYLLVGSGAAAGAITRYGVNQVAATYKLGPWHTFGINFVGSFALGAIMARFPPNSKYFRITR